MLTDLTEKFDAAKSRQSLWTQSCFMQFFESILAILDSKLDWDEGAGENWAVFLNGETIALVSTIIPLAFVRAGYIHKLRKTCSNQSVIAISVNDFDEKKFSLTTGKILEIFGIDETDIDNLGRAVSANDIWFHTV